MNCESTRELLNAYLDSELPEAQRRAVEEHVAACEACRVELRALRRTAELIRSLPHVQAPRGLAGRVRARLNRLRAARRRAWMVRWAGAAGSLAAAAVVAVLILSGPFEPSGETDRDHGAGPARKRIAAADSKGDTRPAELAKSATRPPEPKIEATRRRAAKGAPAEAGEKAAEYRQPGAVSPKPHDFGATADAALPKTGRAVESEIAQGRPLGARRTLARQGNEGADAADVKAPGALQGHQAAGAKPEPNLTVTYACRDLNEGLAAVRGAIEKTEGAKLTEPRLRKAKDGETPGFLVVSVPRRELARLLRRLGPRAEAAKRATAKEGVRAMNAARGGTGGGRGGAAERVLVRIELRTEADRK
jgi:hypothetical protein